MSVTVGCPGLGPDQVTTIDETGKARMPRHPGVDDRDELPGAPTDRPHRTEIQVPLSHRDFRTIGHPYGIFARSSLLLFGAVLRRNQSHVDGCGYHCQGVAFTQCCDEGHHRGGQNQATQPPHHSPRISE